MSSSVSCVLKRRDQPPKKDDKSNESTPASKPIDVANPSNLGPNKSASGHIDPQVQMDLDAFYRPTNLEYWERAEQSKEPLAWKMFTGHKLEMKSGNFKNAAYTDSSSDILINKIASINSDKSFSNEQKYRSSEFAKQIESVKILDSRGTLFSVLITYTEGLYRAWNPESNTFETKKDKAIIKTKKLSGPSKEDGRYASLIESQSNSTSAKQDAMDSELKGELRCLDLVFKFRCSNYLLHVTQTKPDGAEAHADIVFRSATAKISDVKLDHKIDQPVSEKTTQLYDLFNKTYDDHYFEEKRIKMYSITVANGISEFKVELETNKGESISLGGPLVAGIGNSVPMKFPLNKNPDFKIFKESAKNLTDLTQLFDVAYLNFNNGRGKIKISFANTSNSDEPTKQYPEEVSFTLTNEVSPLIQLTKESIYFTPEQ